MNCRGAGYAILVCCVISAVAVGQESGAKPRTRLEQTLIAAEKDFHDAARKGDSAFFKRTLTEDFSYVGFDGQLGDRQQMLDERSDSGFAIQPYNMKVVSLDEGAAIVTYDVVLRVPPAQDEGPPPRYQHFSTTWVKQGDDWKMKFLQMTASHWGDW